MTFNEQEALERLAALEHEQWAHWTRYMLDNLTPENIERWKRQIETPYSELTEREKEADRDWARKALAACEALSGSGEPVAWMIWKPLGGPAQFTTDRKGVADLLSRADVVVTPLYAAPAVKADDVKDTKRWRHVRQALGVRVESGIWWLEENGYQMGSGNCPEPKTVDEAVDRLIKAAPGGVE